MTRSVDLPTYLNAGTHTNVNTHPESAPRKQHKTNRNKNTNRAHTDPQRDRKIHTDTYLRLWLMTASCNRARQHQDRARPSQTEPDRARYSTHILHVFSAQLVSVRTHPNRPTQTTVPQRHTRASMHKPTRAKHNHIPAPSCERHQRSARASLTQVRHVRKMRRQAMHSVNQRRPRCVCGRETEMCAHVPTR
jgi:hypothetical protein